MGFTHECGTSLNNWHNGATLVQIKLAELRSDKPFFCGSNCQGLTRTSHFNLAGPRSGKPLSFRF